MTGARLPSVVVVHHSPAEIADALIPAIRAAGHEPTVDLVACLMGHCFEETNFALWANSWGFVKLHGKPDDFFYFEGTGEILSWAQWVAARDSAPPRESDPSKSSAELRSGDKARGTVDARFYAPHPMARFVGAATFELGAVLWLRTLTGARYLPAFERATAGDVAGYVELLKSRGPYFTAAIGPYKANVVSNAKRFRVVAQAAITGGSMSPSPSQPSPVLLPIVHEWADVECAGFRYRVSRDAVKTGGIRQSYSPAGIAQLCQELDAVAPVPELLDARYMAAEIQNQPAPQNIQLPRAEAIRRHNQAIDLHEHPGDIVGNVGKHHCYPLELELIYGWHLLTEGLSWKGIQLYPCASGLSKLRVIQRVSAAHRGPDDTKIDGEQDDYSMTGVVVFEECVELATGKVWRTVDTPIYRARASKAMPPLVPGRPSITIKGQVGPLVLTWQRWLATQGAAYAATLGKPDGDHGGKTEAATLAWLRDRGLERDGRGGTKIATTVAPPAPPLLGVPTDIETARAYLAGLPYRAAKLSWDRPEGASLIMIHAAEVDPRVGAAKQLAIDCSVNGAASWNFSTDATEVWCSVRIDRASGAARGARHAVHIEMGTRTAKKDQKTGKWRWLTPVELDWSDAYHTAMREQTRVLVRAVSLVLAIPLRRLSLQEILDGQAGVCTHGDWTVACHEAQKRDMRHAPWWSAERLRLDPASGGWAGGDHLEPPIDVPGAASFPIASLF